MSVVLDFRAHEKTVSTLTKMGTEVIKTPRLLNVYDAICGHPDIMLHPLDEKTAVCEPSVFEYFSKNLKNIRVIKGNTRITPKYPFDIAYNCARVGKNVFCNEKYTDAFVLDYYRKNGFNIINTKQGYAKCNICVISDNALITSDKNIARAAEKNGIDVLFSDDGAVSLKGFEHGFFGGATGLFRGNLLVNGNVERHANCGEIIDFCALYGVQVTSLNDEEIEDIGSIIEI